MAQKQAPRGGGGGRGGRQSGPDEGQSKTLQYRDYSDGLVIAGDRAGIPDTALWESTNAQVIGPGQIQTLPAPAASIATLPSAAVSLWGIIMKLSGSEVSRLVAISTDGSIRLINPDTGALTVIAGAAGVHTPVGTRVTMWRDTHILFGDPGGGLATWDGTTYAGYPATFTATLTNGVPTITWTGGGMPASAIIAGMDLVGTGIPAGTSVIGVAGTTITMSANATASGSQTVTIGTGVPNSILDLAVFESRLWVVTGERSYAFTGPGSFTAFSTAFAGGSALFTDPAFPGPITSFTSAIQLLWATSPGAVNTISNVQVQAGITTFQNENLVAGVGTPFGDSVQPLFRTMVFLTPAGVYAILGATPQKLSDALDSLFPDVAGFGTGPAAVFTLNNILVYAVMVTLSGKPRLLVYSRPTWSLADQGDTLVWITSLIRTAGQIQCWGTDGLHVFQLFAGTIGSYSVRSKLFDYGAFTTEKTVRRVAVEVELTDVGVADLHMGVENETGLEVEVGAFQQFVTWINTTLTTVLWQNNAFVAVNWISSGHIMLRGDGMPGFSGGLLGYHLYGTNSVPLVLSAVAWEIGAAGEWTAGG